MSHVSVKHIKLQSRKSASNRTSAVNSSILFWRARTFDRVIVGRGCLLPRFFSRSLTPLDPRFLPFFSFPITSTMSQRFTFKSGHGVWRWKENKDSRGYLCKTKTPITTYYYLCKMARTSCPCSPSKKIAGTSHTEGSTPPQTKYTSLPSSYTCMYNFTNVQRPQETQQRNDETGD